MLENAHRVLSSDIRKADTFAPFPRIRGKLGELRLTLI
jgi:hypothetical protein